MSDDFRTFFYRVFAHDPRQRRAILKRWHDPYPVRKDVHQRLAHVFQEFIVDLLYEPIEFKLRLHHFCFFARGKASLAVQTKWLKKKERTFLVERVFAERKTLFSSVKTFENNEFAFDGFVHDAKPLAGVHPYQRICDPVWQREIVRDFMWLVFARKESYMVLEFIVALQSIMLSHPMGRSDIFVSRLHSGMQGMCNVREVLCWGNEPFDVHSEEDYQKRIKPQEF